MSLANQYYNEIESISAVSTVIPILLCLCYIKTLNTTLRVLLFYLVISLTVELFSAYYKYCTKGQSVAEAAIVQNIFTLLESILLTFIYYIQFSSEQARKIIMMILEGYLLLAFAALYIQGLTVQNNIMTIVEAWLMIGLALAFFYKIIVDLQIPRLVDNYSFWFNVAIIFSFATSSIIFLFSRHITRNAPMGVFQRLYTPHLIMNIIYHLLLTISVWKARTK